MKLATDTITVFNQKHDAAMDADLWYGTVIRNVSWYDSMQDTVTDKGLRAANRYTIRIPEDADLGGKMYVLPTMFAAAEITDNLFTFAAGDVIVKGEAPVTGQTPVTLKKAYEMCTVLGVTDNRRAPNAPHLRITGA